jgi:hypothetical protein
MESYEPGSTSVTSSPAGPSAMSSASAYERQAPIYGFEARALQDRIVFEKLGVSVDDLVNVHHTDRSLGDGLKAAAEQARAPARRALR